MIKYSKLLLSAFLFTAAQAQADDFNYLNFKMPSEGELPKVQKEVAEMSETLIKMSKVIKNFKLKTHTLKQTVADLNVLSENFRDGTIFILEQNIFEDLNKIEALKGSLELDGAKFYLRKSAEEHWLFSSTYEGMNSVEWLAEYKRHLEGAHKKSDLESAERNIAKLSLEVQSYQARLKIGETQGLKFDYRVFFKSIKDYFTGLGQALFDVQSSIEKPGASGSL